MTATLAVPTIAAFDGSETREPYVGPRAFRVGEHLYGRDKEVDELAAMLMAERIVLCHAPSGAGKTSLIQALLIPRLREKFVVLGPTKVGRQHDLETDVAHTNRYVLSALVGLEHEVEGPQHEQQVRTPEPLSPAALAGMTISDYLTQREASLKAGQRVVLIFDQFEEILTVDSNDVEAKLEFFRQLGDALRPLNRWALFAIRDEYVASLDPYVQLVPTRLAEHYALELLEKDAAREAIARPAADAGIPFTDEAVARLVDSLRRVSRPGSSEPVLGRFVEPVQLQVVCTRLWRELTAGTTEIGRTVVDSLGDVDTALAEYYADAVRRTSEKSGVSERAIRRWLGEALIHGNVRTQVAERGEAEYGLTPDVVKALRDAYVIRFDERHSSTWYELAHDRLIHPIIEDNERWFRERTSDVERYAVTWYSAGRSSKDGLLRGNALRDAREWVGQHSTEVMSQSKVDAFLAASAAHEHERRRVRWLSAVILTLAALIAVPATKYIYGRAESVVLHRRQREIWLGYGLTPLEVDSARKDVHLTYFTRPQDETIVRVLTDLGFETELTTDSIFRPMTVLPNAVKYGRNVDSADVKVVVFALMRADTAIRLQYICPEYDPGIITERQIQIRYAKFWADSIPLTLERARTDPTIRLRKSGRLYWNCPP